MLPILLITEGEQLGDILERWEEIRRLAFLLTVGGEESLVYSRPLEPFGKNLLL